MDKQNFEKNIEDLFELTDTEEDSSSSSNPFETQQFILDLHEISKEAPTPEQVRKIKKIKKKKKNRSQASVSSESTANSVTPGSALPEALTPGLTPAVLEEEGQPKEEFYDAHESFHAIPENQRSNPVAAAALTHALSQHGQVPKAQGSSAVDPKVLDPKPKESAPSPGPVLEAQKEPSVITKPVTGSD